ncbi:hypothetical protein N7462_001284 [Penicillium macrosclerotiorum]|uniref:uncharacterized protein n=1 Tax=Penicillium macrosclerotiorum TaxID=303699 RepID=UPI002547D3C7|nr:uncharacterized protein N7462_001284 [Penicillium macrosclerotiorum]KAJ5691861.1 hypothetical protein N7462_001284 [Penicillium macrosclerotiorum]
MQRLVEPIVSQAINMFTSAYAGGLYFDYVPVIYSKQTHSQSLESSFKAVALAYMASETRNKEALRLARQAYGEALSQTNASLQDTQVATTLETLSSVLLLSLFAVISANSAGEIQGAWTNHVQGAFAILSQTPPETFNSRPGQDILSHITSLVQIDCIQREVPFPPQLRSLYSASWLNQGPQEQFWAVVEQVADVNSRINEQDISYLYLSKLWSIDSKIQSLLSSMPDAYGGSFAFEATMSQEWTRGTEDLDTAIPFHKFTHFRCAQTWNILRMLRLFNLNLILSATDLYLEQRPNISQDIMESLKFSISNHRHVSRQTVVDICATIPDILRSNSQAIERCSHVQNSTWARSLLWPLCIARESVGCTQKLREYIDGQIQTIQAATGLPVLINKKSLSSSSEPTALIKW